jgi:hypothetical protein
MRPERRIGLARIADFRRPPLLPRAYQLRPGLAMPTTLDAAKLVEDAVDAAVCGH